jgi:hypothetical protein
LLVLLTLGAGSGVLCVFDVFDAAMPAPFATLGMVMLYVSLWDRLIEVLFGPVALKYVLWDLMLKFMSLEAPPLLAVL